MNHKLSDKGNINRLKKIEGQIRGIIRMVENQRECIDIITQINAVEAALRRVQDRILSHYLEKCVAEAMRSNSAEEIAQKLDEVLQVFRQFRR
jgi:DNA-binding FrmR family transcriptional regulator